MELHAPIHRFLLRFCRKPEFNKVLGFVSQGRLATSITMDIYHMKWKIQSVLNWLTVFCPMSSAAKLREVTNIEEKPNPSNITAG